MPIYSNYLEDLSKDINQNNFYSKALEALSYNNKIYAIPRDISTLMIYYNKTLFKKYNVPFEVHIFNEGEHGMSLSNINVYHETRLNEIKKINSIWLKLLHDYFLKNDFVIKD